MPQVFDVSVVLFFLRLILTIFVSIDISIDLLYSILQFLESLPCYNFFYHFMDLCCKIVKLGFKYLVMILIDLFYL